jgi:hypothetical protein
MKRYFLPTITCPLLLSGKAVAGWYHVENYIGFVGPDPIHFSIQRYDGFGSGITVEGSYFYDAKQSPVAIYGKANGTRLELCEIADDKEFHQKIIMGSKTPFDTSACPLSLDVNESGATGTWTKGTVKYPVTLKKVAMLDDTGPGKVEGTVEIPFWAQTKKHMFSGIYTNRETGICMETLQIINKRSRKVDQTIHFKDDDICTSGTLMTTIYRNVEKDTQKGDAIYVNFSNSSAGYSVDYGYDRKTGKYKLKR